MEQKSDFKQLTLPLCSASASYKSLDFFVDPCNAEAYAWVQKPPSGACFCTVIYGPPGAGKTHLGFVFKGLTGGRFWNPETLTCFQNEGSQVVPSIVDDVPLDGTLSLEQERSLFYLYNALKEKGLPLLILTPHVPAQWALKLQDIASRLRGATCLGLGMPSDALVHSVYAKLFSDHQVGVSPHVLSYLVKMSPRSLQAVRQRVQSLVAESFRFHKPLTIPFVREHLSLYGISPCAEDVKNNKNSGVFLEASHEF